MEAFGLKPDLADFNSLIDIITKVEHVERTQLIIKDMRRKMNLSLDLSPDIKTNSILLEVWGYDRNLWKVKEIFREMIDEGFNPDVVTYGIGFNPDVVTYGILINCFYKLEKWDEATETLREMEASDIKASPHIYCTLINRSGSAKRLDGALKHFRLSKASGFVPELPTYNAVMGAYSWVLRFEDVFKVVEEMRRNGICMNIRTYNIILYHLIKTSKKDEAYRVFKRMGKEEGCEPQLNTYIVMVSMFCSGEIVDLALKVWNDKGVLPCMHMFSAMINALCFENRLNDDCKCFVEMLNKGIKPSGQLFSNLKTALLAGGKQDLALELESTLDRLHKISLGG